MTEHSIRVKSASLYEIEVNDAGETISFDAQDIELPFRVSQAADDARKIAQKLQASFVVADKEQTEDGRAKKRVDALRKYYPELRKIINTLCGDDEASRKIFGDKNYLSMFNDFFDAMRPHWDAMKVKSEDVMAKIKDKYGESDEEDVL